MNLETDVLVIGAGGAGMYAAIAAARSGARVLLADRNMIGRGGATVMAQMTVAAALAEEEPDSTQAHLDDTLGAGRGLCDARLAELVCAHAPDRLREMDSWGVGWARSERGIRQVHAPGHGVKRCAYVDVLNTGPAVAGTLRKQVGRMGNITRVSGVQITDLAVCDGEVNGAVGVGLDDGVHIRVVAPAVVLACGGLTRLFARSSASNNMLGDAFALALRAGAALIDMEFVQFFPIGHLAPRLVGMDPIMWDPFRYKLGGRLLNGEREEFIHRYGGEDDGVYRATRDLATAAIIAEVANGRGSPAGGAYLSFAHVGEAALREAFGPVIDRLLANGIDLTRAPIEVAPIAHYHMGGIEVDERMHTGVPGLLAAGEAVGGASGANRLSGNAISEALVFGDIAGREAASIASRRGRISAMAADTGVAGGDACDPAASLSRLDTLRERMWRDVGPIRNAEGLQRTRAWIAAERAEHARSAPPPATAFANALCDWHDVRNALLSAEAVAAAALARRESRGAHQRDDHITTDPHQAYHQRIVLEGDRVMIQRAQAST